MDSKSLTTNLERTGLVQKETGTLSVFSPTGFTSPGNVPDTKSYKKIQMVTSTPLLKTAESVKINENRLLQESEVNSLFNAGSSAVKHYSNNIRTDRLRITPNANFSAKNNVKDILPDSPTLPIMKILAHIYNFLDSKVCQIFPLAVPTFSMYCLYPFAAQDFRHFKK